MSTRSERLASRAAAIKADEKPSRKSFDYSFIEKDPRVERLLSRVRSGEFGLDYPAIRKEVRSLHKGRQVSTLNYEQLGSGVQKTWIDASLQNQANRTRVASLYLDIIERRSALENLMERLKPFLKVEYSEQLARNFKTNEDRSNALRVALAPAYEELASLAEIEELVKVVLNDSDTSAWTLTGVREALKMTMGRGRE